MRAHWYWPFAREEELELARCTIRGNDEIVAQVVDRPAAPPAGERMGVTVVRDLPDVRRDVGRMMWAPSRAHTYWHRERMRRRSWSADDFDLFHLHYLNRFTDGVVPLPVRPVIFSVHDVTPHRLRFNKLLEQALLKRLYGRPTALVVHHRWLADQLVEHFGVPASNIHVIPHQVFPVPLRYREQQPVHGEILFFGTLRPNKGLTVLLDAFADIQREDVRLVIAGRGDRDLEQQALAAARHDPRISVKLGFASLTSKRELFAASSIVALPYVAFSSQSGVLHDAYGHARPVVVSDVGALGHSVREDGTGLVVPPGDPAALRTALVRMLEHDRWADAATNAARTAAERSPQNVGAELRCLYDDLIR